jgi:hypothetical protein
LFINYLFNATEIAIVHESTVVSETGGGLDFYFTRLENTSFSSNFAVILKSTPPAGL